MKRLTTNDFISKAKQVHGNKYDYSKVEYINKKTKVCIICPIHGEFWQTPDSHANGRRGCPKCGTEFLNDLQKEKAKLSSKTFEEKSRMVHGNKYDYSKANYKNALTKVDLICPNHGVFSIRPNDHLNGCGCPKCGIESRSKKNALTTEEFINKAKEIHGDKYDYSKVEYINNHTKVCIICPKHGEFWQTPTKHLYYQGCPKCSESFLEEKVRSWLEKRKIEYIYQKTFKWLINERPMYLDFYLPKYNIGIECQGLQHYKPVDFANKGEEWALDTFQKNKKRDTIKKTLCNENGVKLIYFKYNDKIITLKNKIL